MRKTLAIILAILLSSTMFGLEITSSTYDLNSNILELNFDETIRTSEVLIGLLTFSDGLTSLTMDGGQIVTEDELSSSIEISMIYGKVIDDRANADNLDGGTASDWPRFLYWGNTNELANSLEDMMLENLTLSVGAGAFVNTAYAGSNAVTDLPVVLLSEDDNHPIVLSAEYDMNTNQLQISFDRPVQFDQIAEDRTCTNGQNVCPGNGIKDGAPPEDGFDLENDITFGNNNGVLDMEANINIFKVGFSSSGGFMTLEGMRSIAETTDSDIITVLLTRDDAKKLELGVLLEDVVLNIYKGAFVDTYYNPNNNQSISFNIIEDDLPLILTNASYDKSLNEFRITFNNSRNVTPSSPPPVYGKISISDGVNTAVLNGVALISGTVSHSIVLSELLLSDQSTIEQLIFNAEQSGLPLTLNVDEYAIYDINGNGNLATEPVPLDLISEWGNPVLSELRYSAANNRLEFVWSPYQVVYYKYDRIFVDAENYPFTGLTITDMTSGEIYNVTSVDVSRSANREITYLKFNSVDAGWFETAGYMGHTLHVDIAPYAFYSSGNTNNNGNLAESMDVVYMSDESGPAIESVRLDERGKILTIEFDKNILASTLNLSEVDFIVNGVDYSINDLQLIDIPDFTPVVSYQLTDAAFEGLADLVPYGEIIHIRMQLPDNVAANSDNVYGVDYYDLNGNGMWDDTPEPLDDFGSDGIPNEQEAGYPGSCAEEGECSDPTYDNQVDCENAFYCTEPGYDNEFDCLEEDGTCSNPRKYNKTDCEGAGGIWYPDYAWISETWTPYLTQTLCEDAGALWIDNLDPAGDDYDAVNNPGGTEGNGLFDPGETYTDEYPNGVWDQYEPITKEIIFGQYLWNESHRAFAEAPELMFFAKKLETDEFVLLVEENVWNGFCKNDEDDAVYDWVTTEAACDLMPDNTAHTPAWVRITAEDVANIQAFFGSNVGLLESKHGELIDLDGNGKVSVALYDIIDEFSKGSNDTNTSLITHGYYHLDEEAGETTNAGDFMYIDVSPQYFYTGNAVAPDLGSMQHALIHEYTKLLVNQNEPDEELWLREGLAFFEQKRILDNVKFFGDGLATVTASQNQLNYITYSQKSRVDQYNIYNFFTYLFEKYTHTDGWDIIDAIASTPDAVGVEAVNAALIALGFEATMADIFIDYATACFMDVDHQDNIYDGKYTFDLINLYAAPASKNAGVWKFTDSQPPPYSNSDIQPWSFNYYLIEGLSVSLVDNRVTVKSPLLNVADDLIFDGYNGINFRAKKIVLKNGFINPMNALYEVVDIDINVEDGLGTIPLVTNSIPLPGSADGLNPNSYLEKCSDAQYADQADCEAAGETWGLYYNFTLKDHYGVCSDGVSGSFEDCCLNGGGIWGAGTCEGGSGLWTWYGNQNLAIVVAKVDDAQPPNTYDFVFTNVTSVQDYSEFYVIQNDGILNFLDFYVISQRPIFSESGVEGPEIRVSSLYDTNTVVLEPTEIATEDYVLYHNVWQLGNWINYTAEFSGMDQNGIPVETQSAMINTIYTFDAAGRSFDTPNTLASLMIPDIITQNLRLTGMEYSSLGRFGIPEFAVEGLTAESEMIYYGPKSVKLEKPFELSIKIADDITNPVQIYTFRDGNWINIGGRLEGNSVKTGVDELGYFLAASGGDHLPVHEVYVLPEEYVLSQNYPNPFNAGTSIDYFLPEAGDVSIRIYNLNGQLVNTLVNGFQDSRWHSVVWNALDRDGMAVPSGVYFMKFEANDIVKTQKMVLMK